MAGVPQPSGPAESTSVATVVAVVAVAAAAASLASLDDAACNDDDNGGAGSKHGDDSLGSPVRVAATMGSSEPGSEGSAAGQASKRRRRLTVDGGKSRSVDRLGTQAQRKDMEANFRCKVERLDAWVREHGRLPRDYWRPRPLGTENNEDERRLCRFIKSLREQFVAASADYPEKRRVLVEEVPGMRERFEGWEHRIRSPGGGGVARAPAAERKAASDGVKRKGTVAPETRSESSSHGKRAARAPICTESAQGTDAPETGSESSSHDKRATRISISTESAQAELCERSWALSEKLGREARDACRGLWSGIVDANAGPGALLHARRACAAAVAHAVESRMELEALALLLGHSTSKPLSGKRLLHRQRSTGEAPEEEPNVKILRKNEFLDTATAGVEVDVAGIAEPEGLFIQPVVGLGRRLRRSNSASSTSNKCDKVGGGGSGDSTSSTKPCVGDVRGHDHQSAAGAVAAEAPSVVVGTGVVADAVHDAARGGLAADATQGAMCACDEGPGCGGIDSFLCPVCGGISPGFCLEDLVRSALAGTHFPRQMRPNVVVDGTDELDALPHGLLLGAVSCYGTGACLSVRTLREQAIVRLLCRMIRAGRPDFKFTSIQVNKNYATALHVDQSNLGTSTIVAIGNYTGGQLYVHGTGRVNIQRRWFEFDGNSPHLTCPFEGERFSIIYFTTASYESLSSENVKRLKVFGFNWPKPGLRRESIASKEARLRAAECELPPDLATFVCAREMRTPGRSPGPRTPRAQVTRTPPAPTKQEQQSTMPPCVRCGLYRQSTRKAIGTGLCCNRCPNHGVWCARTPLGNPSETPSPATGGCKGAPPANVGIAKGESLDVPAAADDVPAAVLQRGRCVSNGSTFVEAVASDGLPNASPGCGRGPASLTPEPSLLKPAGTKASRRNKRSSQSMVLADDSPVSRKRMRNTSTSAPSVDSDTFADSSGKKRGGHDCRNRSVDAANLKLAAFLSASATSATTHRRLRRSSSILSCVQSAAELTPNHEEIAAAYAAKAAIAAITAAAASEEAMKDSEKRFDDAETAFRTSELSEFGSDKVDSADVEEDGGTNEDSKGVVPP